MASKKPYGDWNKAVAMASILEVSQVFREEMEPEPFLSKDHELVVPKVWKELPKAVSPGNGRQLDDFAL